MTDIVIALARANLYGFFSAIFSAPPSEALVESLHDGSLQAALAENGWMPDGNVQMSLQDAAQLRDELAVAFTRLFVGPGKGYIPPYSSLYLDKSANGRRSRPTLWGPATVWVAQVYEEAGLELVTGQIPDHIGVELEFMRHLCAQEAKALRLGDEVSTQQCRQWQATFLYDHLLQWVPDWGAEVETSASHVFYRSMARLVIDFLTWEAETLAGEGIHAHSQARSNLCALPSLPSPY